jgi:NADPH2:quinone reductase
LYSAADWRDQLKTLLAGRALTVVYDPVGGDFADPALRSLSPGARYLVIGFASGSIPKFAANLTLLKQISIVGVNWGGHIMIHPEASQPVIVHLLSRIQARQLNPEAGQCFALADAGLAMTAMLDRQAIGKIVITQE